MKARLIFILVSACLFALLVSYIGCSWFDGR